MRPLDRGKHAGVVEDPSIRNRGVGGDCYAEEFQKQAWRHRLDKLAISLGLIWTKHVAFLAPRGLCTSGNCSPLRDFKLKYRPSHFPPPTCTVFPAPSPSMSTFSRDTISKKGYLLISGKVYDGKAYGLSDHPGTCRASLLSGMSLNAISVAQVARSS